MNVINHSKNAAWLEKNGSRLVYIMGLGSDSASALDNLADILYCLAQQAESMSRDERYKKT